MKSAPSPLSAAGLTPSVASFAALGRLSPVAQWFQTLPAPAGPGGIPLAQIRQNLADVRVGSDERDLGQKPNFIALNEIASANTPAKRAAFAELKGAQAKLNEAESRVLSGEKIVETRRNAVDAFNTEIGDRSMRVAARRDRVKGLESELQSTTAPDDRRALNTELREARTELRGVETELRGLQTRLATASAKFSKWVKDNGLSHNRALRSLNEQLGGARAFHAGKSAGESLERGLGGARRSAGGRGARGRGSPPCPRLQRSLACSRLVQPVRL